MTSLGSCWTRDGLFPNPVLCCALYLTTWTCYHSASYIVACCSSSQGIDGEELVRRPKQAVPVTNLNMITQLCNLLAATITDHPRMADPQILEALFIFCTIWSLGATCTRAPLPKRAAP